MLQHGCNLSFKPSYLLSTFVYSKTEDAVFYLHCSLFCNSDTNLQSPSFVNGGYSEWQNILEKQKKGVDKEYHSTAMTKAFEIVERFEKSC